MDQMKAEVCYNVRLFFYRALPMILMQSVISGNIYEQYNLSRCEETLFVLFLLLNSSSLMCMHVVLSIGPVTERYARHVGSIYRALTNWFAISVSGYISYYITAHSPKGILQFDYNYSENELKAVICSSMLILMSFMSFCPGLDLNIPNALASIGVFMSLVLDSAPAREYYYYGYRIRYPMYACVSVYSLIQSLFKYYVPYKSHELPTAAAAVAIYGFAICPSLPGVAWTAVLIILFQVLLNGR